MQPPKPYREKRPWGDFIEFTRNVPSTVKVITVNAGEAFSLQHHLNRDEFWHMLSGEGTIIIGEEQRPIEIGSDHFVPRGSNHRVEAGIVPVVFLEISFGTFDEADIVRIDDRYGRKTQ